MELLNATRMKAGYTMGLRPDGRELLVVVVKGTFLVPEDPENEPSLAPAQADLVMADTFTGEPGLSATIYESDFPPAKPRCDVILHGSAWAPRGEPVTRVRVGLRVGSMRKRFTVVGNRVWRRILGFDWRSSPEPFTRLPISYDHAFGGTDKTHPDEKKHRACVANPVGRGFHANRAKEVFDGRPLPNTQAPFQPILRPRGRYRPMAFGPIGRAWPPRPKYAGTYDQNWIDNIFPFLPSDFDERYFQCAPPDQQIDHPRGGELVVLENLTPQGLTRFKLPIVEMPVTFYRKDHEETEMQGTLDTVILEPDLGRFMLVWRAAVPLKKNIFEMAQVVAGRMPRAWYRARELGKTWYPSLAALVDSKRAEREEEFEDAVSAGHGDAETGKPS